MFVFKMLCKILVIVICFVYSSAVNDITEYSFGQNKEGVIAAFGDFNSDELTDAFLIINSSNVEVLLAHDKEPFLRPSVYACNFSDIIITSIVPGDYDGDAYMDILITTQIKNITTNLHEVRILWGGKPNLNCSDALLVKAITFGQPLVIDYNRDMILDLFGVNQNNKRVFWVFNKSRLPPTEVPMGDEMFKNIKVPHSHSFLDMNNDNAADLLITTEVDIELWLSKEVDGFVYNNSIELLVGHPAIYGQALFLDVALSGQFFLVIPVCYDVECINSSILIHDNKQWHDIHIDLNESGKLWRFTPPRNEIYLDTITLRSGDFNMDGYPDILMTLSPVSSDETRVFLLHNMPCTHPECVFYRTYEVEWDKFNSFGKNVVMATFYDFYMDGVLDVVYIKKNTTTNKYTLHAYKNELEYDTNFIKVIVITGLIEGKNIEAKNIEAQKCCNIFPYSQGKYYLGTNLPGPKISYDTWSQEGTYRTGVCAQLSQSGHFALQLPYSIFGLDRTPNFVDTLNVGLSGYSKSWNQIIPNSQIVVIPTPPNNPSKWRVQLFVTPSKALLKVFFVILAIVILITLLVLYLHYKENSSQSDIIEIGERTYAKL